MASSLRYRIVNLTSRGLIQVTGKDSFPYIQSILTSDLRSPSNVLYGTFLNASGRVLLDMMVYKINGNPSERQLMLNALGYKRYGIDGRPDDSLLIECDSDLLEPARKTLFAYKIRKDVTISHASEYNLFAIYPEIDDIRKINCANLPQLSELFSTDLIVAKDPRVGPLAYRVATRLGHNSVDSVKQFLSHQIPFEMVEASLSDYQIYRYKLGLAEGKDDHRPCFINPWDANIDYSNGLSLIKGQFTGKKIVVGNKLVRPFRTYRMMPVELILPEGQTTEVNKLNLAFGTRIANEDKQRLLGFLINRKGSHGLAILQIIRSLDSEFLLTHVESGIKLKTWFPTWWPQPLLPKHLYGKRKLIGQTRHQQITN